MTNKNDNRVPAAAKPSQPSGKKPYQAPVLTVHGRVDQITKFLLAISHH